MTKKILILILIVGSLFLGYLHLVDHSNKVITTDNLSFKVQKIKGSATITRKQQKISLQKNMQLYVGETISTAAKSFLVITFGANNCSKIVVGQNSKLTLAAHHVKEGSQITFHLLRGKLMTYIQEHFNFERYQIKTKVAALGVRGTIFYTNITTDNKFLTVLKEGAINLTSSGHHPIKLTSGAAASLANGKLQIIPNFAHLLKWDSPEQIINKIAPPAKLKIKQYIILYDEKVKLFQAQIKNRRQTVYEIRIPFLKGKQVLSKFISKVKQDLKCIKKQNTCSFKTEHFLLQHGIMKFNNLSQQEKQHIKQVWKDYITTEKKKLMKQATLLKKKKKHLQKLQTKYKKMHHYILQAYNQLEQSKYKLVINYLKEVKKLLQ